MKEAAISISRRQFCAGLGGAAVSVLANRGGGQTTLTRPAATTPAGTQAASLVVIAYNVQVCTGWPASRKRAKAALAAGEMPKLIADELLKYSPDILNFSESPSEAVTKEIARLLKMNYVRFPSGASWPGTILTRFKILDSKNAPVEGGRPKDLFTRHWGCATIELPSGEKVVVHSAHLYPFNDGGKRAKEVKAMLGVMEADLKAGRSMLAMGDFNHEPKQEEYALWTEAGWVDTFAKVGKGDGLTRDADVPKRRIDYVMAAGPIAGRIVEARPLFEGAFRLDLKDPEAYALSDHVPQLARFSVG